MTPPKIDGYQFGRINIAGVSYTKDVLIFPEGVRPNWWRKEGHSLSIDDLEEVLVHQPSLLIVGLGAVSRMQIPDETIEDLEEVGIRVEAFPTKEACARYNKLKDLQITVAALHLTC